MKRFTICLLALTITVTAFAQVEDDWDKKMKEARESALKDFEGFKQQVYDDYEDFRRQANENYAKFMEEAWKAFDVNPAEEIPWQPKPVVPLEADAPTTNSKIEYDILIESPSNRLSSSVLPMESLSKIEIEESQPEPMGPILPIYESNDIAMQPLLFYGSLFQVRVEASKGKPLKLKDASEKSVAKMWKKLSSPYYDNIVAECLQQRKDRNLCDWAYVKLAEKMANKYFEPDSNESVVLQMYILTQSGYQMRMARADDKLTLLMGSKEKIYRYKYFVMDNVKYYIIDKSMQNKSMYVYDQAFPNEKLLSLAVRQPKIQLNKTEQRTLVAEHYPNVNVTIEFNKNLLDFYNEYPISGQWNYYSKASISDVAKQELYPVLQHAIEGKNDLEAVNILLDFVQTGLEYKTDQEQFGYERPLYPDESMFYPFCDCEDRSILFSCLVRELVGLDVVLLNYPSHLTTAVHFNEDVKGDYLMVDDEVYVICEPTFLKGAPVGRSGPQFRNQKPTVIKF